MMNRPDILRRHIDINCDMGESYLSQKVGNDNQVMPLISSCNIATGYHGGDPMTIDRTIDLALAHKVKIGAHPSYPDIEGFGRRPFTCTPRELYLMITYQLGGFLALLYQKNQKLNHIKPHGQLYHDLQNNKPLASAFISAVQEIDDKMPIGGKPGSELFNICQIRVMPFIGEGFIDRSYNTDGSLKSRKLPDAVITSKEFAAEQALNLCKNEEIKTLCVHGDNAEALYILHEIHRIFERENILIQSYI